MRNVIFALSMMIGLMCGAVSAECAQTTIKLTTSAGVCTFNADTFTVGSTVTASGAFLAGCVPSTVPPGTGGGGGGDLPPTCAALPAGRMPSASVKWTPGNVVRTVDTLHYDGVFGVDPTRPGVVTGFPGVFNYVVTVSSTAGQYSALEFTTPSTLTTTSAGSWTFTQTGSTGVSSVSLSQCPGDFTGGGQTYCHSDNVGEGGGIAWSGKPAVFSCAIKPNTRYYLNFRQQSCTTGKCAFSVKNSYYHS